MMLKKIIVLFSILLVLLALWNLLQSSSKKKLSLVAYAGTLDCDGDYDNSNVGDERGAECITPTPICTASPTPTPTPTVEITPAPTATPSVSFQSSNQSPASSNNTPGQANPGTCGDSLPGDIPNFAVKVVKEGIELDWALPQNAKTIALRFGYANSGVFQFGMLNIPNDTGHYTVNNLQPNTAYDFEIAGVNGCAVGKWSGPVDPIWKPAL